VANVPIFFLSNWTSDEQKCGQQIKWYGMTDLPNRVSENQLHFMVLIIVITLKIVTEHFVLLPPAASGHLLLAHLCLSI
jgi:hypothetical protein